ncbi:hypothetical protein NYY86_29600, partial [Acinetobacter baumannii]|nr:hypothetical protein [Acinetobacter baumannii]
VTLRNQISWKERKPLHGKKVLFAAATNKKSAIKQKLQESGAEIYQIPTFKKKEYTVTSEQINKIFNVDRLVFCSADSVDILMQSCS